MTSRQTKVHFAEHRQNTLHPFSWIPVERTPKRIVITILTVHKIPSTQNTYISLNTRLIFQAVISWNTSLPNDQEEHQHYMERRQEVRVGTSAQWIWIAWAPTLAPNNQVTWNPHTCHLLEANLHLRNTTLPLVGHVIKKTMWHSQNSLLEKGIYIWELMGSIFTQNQAKSCLSYQKCPRRGGKTQSYLIFLQVATYRPEIKVT